MSQLRVSGPLVVNNLGGNGMKLFLPLLMACIGMQMQTAVAAVLRLLSVFHLMQLQYTFCQFFMQKWRYSHKLKITCP